MPTCTYSTYRENRQREEEKDHYNHSPTHKYTQTLTHTHIYTDINTCGGMVEELAGAELLNSPKGISQCGHFVSPEGGEDPKRGDFGDTGEGGLAKLR